MSSQEIGNIEIVCQKYILVAKNFTLQLVYPGEAF
jgi:hypothetical protein